MPYAEGIANHGDPESCGDSREGVIEALTGACAGRAIEPRNQAIPVADDVDVSEGNTAARVIASTQPDRRGRRPHACTEPPRARTGRSTGRPTQMVRRAASERPEAVQR